MESQTALARWCRKNKLADQERVHWQKVLQLQPDNAEAIQRLGLKPFAGLLMSQDQIKQVKAELQSLAKATDRWRPLVAQWRKAVEQIGALHGVSYHDEVRVLLGGQALMGAVRASDRAFVERVRRVSLRPTCVEAGGETLTFV